MVSPTNTEADGSPDPEPGRAASTDADGVGADGDVVVVVAADDADRAGERSARLALGAFIVYLVVAAVLLLFFIGQDRWFVRDEWGFLTNRQSNDFSTFFSSWDQHWTTIPVLVYRVLFTVFGIRSYVPYLAVLVSLHLLTVVLLRVIMRRAGVGPWIATCTAAILVLFGPGQQDILWAFQIAFVGALVFGLLQLLGADHDGPIDRRDWLGLLAGALGLMCSGVGVAMVAVVGIAALTRRGWRTALFHTAPLAVMYAVWYALAKPSANAKFGLAPIRYIPPWLLAGTQATFGTVGHFAVVGVLLVVVVVVGLVVAWLPLDLPTFRRRAAMPLALLLGMPIFFGSTAAARWVLGSQTASSSRYVYIGAALTLPALAVAVDALSRRWRPAAPVLIALLLFVIPWNAGQFEEGGFTSGYTTNERQALIAAARSPLASEVSPDVRPDPAADNTGGLTIGWLQEMDREGKLPASGPTDPQVSAQVPLHLGLLQSEDPNPGVCRSVGPVDINPRQGDVIRFASRLLVSPVVNGKVGRALVMDPAGGSQLIVQLPDLHLRLNPAPPDKQIHLCQ